MNVRTLSLAGLGLLAALALAGCGQTAHAPVTPDGGRPKVALVMKSLANEFFKTMAEGAEAYHRDRADAFDLIVNGIPSEEDVSGQVALVEQMMASQVDAIVIAPADSKALIGVLKRAADAGIVVVNIDNKLDAEVLAERGLQVPFVGPDNRSGARMAAECLAAHLEPGAPVAIIEGIPSAFNAIERREGFREAMEAAGMRIVTSQSANWEMARAQEIASAIVNEHPNLKALLCANDSMALGAAAALRDAGKTGEVQIIGYDNIGAVQELIRAGRMLCTIDQHGDQLAVYGIEYALDILQGEAIPVDMETPVDLVTAETLGA